MLKLHVRFGVSEAKFTLLVSLILPTLVPIPEFDIIVPEPAPGGAIPVIIMQLLRELNENLPAVGICEELSSEVPPTRLTVKLPPFKTAELILIPNCILVYSKTVDPVRNR
jgi:hypothetical protein